MRRVGVFDREADDGRGKHVTPGDPEWSEYSAWLAQHNVPDVPAPAVVPEPEFDFAAAGRARRERVFKRMAKTDPVAAILYREGIKK